VKPMKILTEGLRFPEGPVAMSDGSIALVEIEAQRITRVAADGSKSMIAEVPRGTQWARAWAGRPSLRLQQRWLHLHRSGWLSPAHWSVYRL